MGGLSGSHWMISSFTARSAAMLVIRAMIWSGKEADGC
jgi:hypothetical protein